MTTSANAEPTGGARSVAPAKARAWRVTAVGGALVILAVMTSHATGVPVSQAGATETQAAPLPYLGELNPAQPTQAALPDTSDDVAQRFTGRVGPDLSAALIAAGVPQARGREYVAIIAKAIPIARELSVDDRFDLVIERNDDGSLGQLVYAGLDRVARADVELMKWTDGREIIWVNGDVIPGKVEDGLERPVSGRVTSGFGSRFHPVLGYRRMHKGVDLAAKYGSPIVAAADGRVTSAGWHGGYGNQVAIAHEDGVRTTYGHMSRIAARAGELVHRGQVIGYVGSTGLSTGPHLHFEVTRNGKPIDPLTAKLTNIPAQLKGEKLQAFNNQLRKVLLTPARG